MLRKRRLWGVALIWTAVFGAIAMAWAAQDITGNTRTARDPHQRPAVSTVSAPGSSSGGQAGGAVHDTSESDADHFFRAYMLPGAAVLVVVIAIVLVAIFFPKFEPE